MQIKIYDELVEEKVITIPQKVERPTIRLIIDQGLQHNDILEVILKVNGVELKNSLKHEVLLAPESGNEVVGVIHLAFVEQPTAPLPDMVVQCADMLVTKTASEKLAIKEANILKEEKINIKE